MVTPKLCKVLSGLRGNKKAINFMYNRLFALRPDLKDEYYEKICCIEMFDKVIDTLCSEFDDSKINIIREVHAKLNLSNSEMELYTTMLIDTAITFKNKDLDRPTLKELYTRCDSLIKELTK